MPTNAMELGFLLMYWWAHVVGFFDRYGVSVVILGAVVACVYRLGHWRGRNSVNGGGGG